MAKELRVSAIQEGTVIDHIPPSRGLMVLRLLGLETHDDTISLVMNVPSKKLGRKDLVKIENKHLTRPEFDRIALVAPQASVCIIQNHSVSEKSKASIPECMVGLLPCFNPNCVTNHEEMPTKFTRIKGDDLQVRCHYCERTMQEKDILAVL